MNEETENIEQRPKRDDDDDIIKIKYFDRINHQWIELEVTKKVKRFMKSNNQKRRRKQNRYDYFNKPYDEIFDEDNHPENMKYLIDEEQDPYYILVEKRNRLIKEAQIEENRAMVQNSLHSLKDTHREVIEKILYENKSQNEIAEDLNISQQAVSERYKRATKNIRNYLKNTEN